MTDRDAMLRCVLDAPEEDAPRLVYADACEEEGDVIEATYIRTCVEWDRLPDCGHDWVLRPGGWKCHTCRRKDELHARHTNPDGFPVWEKWLRKLMRSFLPLEVEMRRGFVGSVSCTLAAWLEHGHDCVARQPVTRCVLTDREPFQSNYFPGDFLWADGNRFGSTGAHPASDLPRELFLVLTGGRDDETARYYTTLAAALDALSAALIALAKGKSKRAPKQS